MLPNAAPHTSASRAFFESQMFAYRGYLADIMSPPRAGFSKVSGTQIIEALDRVGALVDRLAMHAPAGFENAIAALKLSVANAHVRYEQAAFRQARGVARISS